MAKLIKGVNDLATLRPDLAKKWHPTKNGNLKPEDITCGSERKIWWLGDCGHEWETMVISMVKQNKGCPYCNSYHSRVLEGFNDLITTHPNIASEWNYEKNGDLQPTQVTYGATRKVWWKCKEGHEWEAKISNRVHGRNCPYCSNKKVLIGYNDLATTHPYLIDEWDFDKNDKKPTEVTAMMKCNAWWKCPSGHSYRSYLYSRCGKQHVGCPICDKQNHTSFPEQALYYYIKRYYPDAINGNTDVIGIELDIYIPSLHIAIEYDGVAYHKTNKFEVKKNKLCIDNNILLIRIREEGLCTYDDCYCIVRHDAKSNIDLSNTIKQVLYDIDPNQTYTVDVDSDFSNIYSSYMKKAVDNNLENIYPEIAIDWNYDKNKMISPSMFAKTSNRKVWWKCHICGYEWQTQINNRTGINKTGCPKCSGSFKSPKKVINLDTNKIYESCGQAAKATNTYTSSISACCRGEYKTAGGYRWKYVDDEK